MLFQISLVDSGGNNITRQGKIVGFDQDYDLAVLKVLIRKLDYLPIVCIASSAYTSHAVNHIKPKHHIFVFLFVHYAQFQLIFLNRIKIDKSNEANETAYSYLDGQKIITDNPTSFFFL